MNQPTHPVIRFCYGRWYRPAMALLIIVDLIMFCRLFVHS